MKTKAIFALLVGLLVMFLVIDHKLDQARTERDAWMAKAQESQRQALAFREVCKTAQGTCRELLDEVTVARLSGWKDGWLSGAADALVLVKFSAERNVSVQRLFATRMAEVEAASNALPTFVTGASRPGAVLEDPRTNYVTVTNKMVVDMTGIVRMTNWPATNQLIFLATNRPVISKQFGSAKAE